MTAKHELEKSHDQTTTTTAHEKTKNETDLGRPTVTANDDNDGKTEAYPQGKLRLLLGKIFWTPPWCRYHPEHPPQFSIFQNILFAFAGAFTVANLYYNHPILNILADDFHVSNAEIARIPTLMQSGYAVGLLLICPLGDLFPRRPYTLILVFFTASIW